MPGLADLLFPPRCVGCGARAWPICATCVREVGVVTPPWCERCGRPAEAPVARCRDCPPGPIDAARAPFIYEGPIRLAIHGMKFSGWHAIGSHLAGAMAELGRDVRVDAVTWVPLSRRRLRRRGFDQAEILARHVARGLRAPLRSLLVRTRDTRAQARLAGTDRRRALAGAFLPRADQAPPRDVLLVDDVMTTGATAAACASTLKAAGIRRVVVLTAARSLEGSIPDRCFAGG